jgi:hypothetical protein
MDTIQPTPLETAVLRCFHDIYGVRGFPPVEEIEIVKRENTGSGRYLDLRAEAEVDIDDGYIDLGGRYVEMPTVPAAIMAVVQVRKRRIVLLEFTAYEGESWNGTEIGWTIV